MGESGQARTRFSAAGPRKHLATLALSLVALACPAVADAAVAGLSTDLTWGITPSEQARTAALVRASGAKWVRLTIQWRDFEPTPGTYNPWNIEHTDQAVRLARAAGAKVVVSVYNAPSWATARSSAEGSVPRDAADYARFMKMLASRYRGQVAAWQVWNEPNYDRFWAGGPDARAYTQLLRAAYPAIKAGDPRARVVFGGLSTSDYDYVAAAYRAGAKGAFDVMAVHPYTYCGTRAPEVTTQRHDGKIDRGSFLAYREVRKLMLANGDAKRIWFTEFGWNTSTARCNPGAGHWQGGVSERKQAQYLRRAFQLARKDRYVEVAIAYNLRNNYWQRDADTPEARYGLMRTDFTPKPAYHAFAAYARTAR